MYQFNTDLLKKFIAPQIDELPNVTLPDLHAEFEQAKAWMQNYFLKSVFKVSLLARPGPMQKASLPEYK